VGGEPAESLLDLAQGFLGLPAHGSLLFQLGGALLEAGLEFLAGLLQRLLQSLVRLLLPVVLEARRQERGDAGCDVLQDVDVVPVVVGGLVGDLEKPDDLVVVENGHGRAPEDVHVALGGASVARSLE
jgi:hypothetical protein